MCPCSSVSLNFVIKTEPQDSEQNAHTGSTDAALQDPVEKAGLPPVSSAAFGFPEHQNTRHRHLLLALFSDGGVSFRWFWSTWHDNLAELFSPARCSC